MREALALEIEGRTLCNSLIQVHPPTHIGSYPPSHTGTNLPLQGWAINAFGSSTLRWVKEPNDSYGEEGRSPKDYSSSLVRGTEGVAGFTADSWASR